MYGSALNIEQRIELADQIFLEHARLIACSRRVPLYEVGVTGFFGQDVAFQIAVSGRKVPVTPARATWSRSGDPPRAVLTLCAASILMGPSHSRVRVVPPANGVLF